MEKQIIMNPVTQQEELHMPAVLKRISDDVRMTENNADGTPKGFRLCDVEITYDNGSKDTVNASVWEASIQKNLFKEGQDIALVIQTEGEYAGFAKVQLQPAKRVDLSLLKESLAKAKGATAQNPDTAAQQRS